MENSLKRKLKDTFQSFIHLYGNTADLYDENDSTLRKIIVDTFKDDYIVEYFDASYNYPPNPAKNEKIIHAGQYRFRSVDECCVNIEELARELSELDRQSQKPKCIIIDLTCFGQDRARESFFRQIPKLFGNCLQKNKLIIIGNQEDLEWLDNAASGIETIEVGKPSSMYIQQYVQDNLRGAADQTQIDMIARWSHGRYQREIKNILSVFKQGQLTQEKMNSLKRETVYAVAESDVKLDDVVGLEDAKKLIYDRVILRAEHAEFFEQLGIKAKNTLLLFGLPGTGKTLCAQAIANSLGATFFPVKMSDVLSKWFGETEQKIRQIFDEANRQERSLIFLDEIDALTSARDSESQNMNRVIAELLTQINCVSGSVLIVAATNRPWSIDSAILRNGRFGNQVHVPLPDRQNREQMLRKLVGQNGSNDIDYNSLVEKTDGFSGADIAALYDEAGIHAIKEKVNGKRKVTGLQMADFESALKRVHSTVKTTDVDKMRLWINGKN